MLDAILNASLILLSCTSTFVAGYLYAMSKTRSTIREIRKQTESVIQRVATAQETLRALQNKQKSANTGQTQTDAPSQEDSSKSSK